MRSKSHADFTRFARRRRAVGEGRGHSTRAAASDDGPLRAPLVAIHLLLHLLIDVLPNFHSLRGLLGELQHLLLADNVSAKTSNRYYPFSFCTKLSISPSTAG